MSDDVKQGEESMNAEEQKRVNSREHLWRAALWAGFTHGDMIIKILKQGHRPWFSELAPLTGEERVYIMGQICKFYFPEMTGETEKDAFKMLGKLYGVSKNRRVRRMERHYGN